MFWFQVLPVRGYPPPMVRSHHGRGWNPRPSAYLCVLHPSVQNSPFQEDDDDVCMLTLTLVCTRVFYNPEYRTLESTGGEGKMMMRVMMCVRVHIACVFNTSSWHVPGVIQGKGIISAHKTSSFSHTDSAHSQAHVRTQIWLISAHRGPTLRC